MNKTLTAVQLAKMLGQPYQSLHNMLVAWPVEPAAIQGRIRRYAEPQALAITIGSLLCRAGLTVHSDGVAKAIRWALTIDVQEQLDAGVAHLVVRSHQCFAARADAIFASRDPERQAAVVVLDLELIRARLQQAFDAVAAERQPAACTT